MIRVNAVDTSLANINISENIIRGSDAYGCDIQVWTSVAGVNVRNVSITNNTLQWKGSPSETILISQFEYGGGSFSTWQDICVFGNTVNSVYEPPTTYPDVGTVNGPYVSATHGSDIVLFNQYDVSSYPVNIDERKSVRIGPMFLGGLAFNSHISGISGELYCQQVDLINSDGVAGHAEFSVLVSNADPIPDGRFYKAIACVSGNAISSSGEFHFWMRPRAIITWGDRAQIGKYSKGI